jgi:hypothetical protein
MLIINGEKYLVEKELSDKYGYSIHWFRKARYSKGKITVPYYKFNNRIFYKQDELDKWFNENINNYA